MIRFTVLLIFHYLSSFTFGTPIWDGEDVGKIQQIGKKSVVSGQTNFPFIVRIDVESVDGPNNCGGVIISRKVVLTAAHCVADKVSPKITIRAGIVDLVHEWNIAQERTVIAHYIHERYRRNCQVGKRCCPLVNDIALLWTAKNFNFGSNVKKANFNCNIKPVGKTGWILGWGLRRNGIYSSMLQKGLVKVTSDQTCEKFNSGIYITQNVICLAAVKGETRAGKGDSGGPFVIDGVVCGLSSFSFVEECRKSSLDVYTYVGKYYTWIKNNMDADPPKKSPTSSPKTTNEPPTKRRKLQ